MNTNLGEKMIRGAIIIAAALALGAAQHKDVTQGAAQGAAQGLFETLDESGDGVLQRREFRRFSQSTYDATGQQRDGLAQRQHFDSVDTNGDGVISSLEFAASSGSGEAPATLQDPEAAAAATLAHFDENGDGRLDGNEMQTFLSMSHGVDTASLDADADGYVTQEELHRLIEQSMTQMGGGAGDETVGA